MKKLVLLTCLVALPFTSFAEETDSKFGVGAKLSTLGAGLDLSYKISDKVSTRLNYNNSSTSYNEVNSGVTYKGDLKLSTTGILVDYHPFANGFRLTGGFYNNKNSIVASSSGGSSVDIGGTTYDITGAGVDTKVGFKSNAPYLGLGWGSNKKGLNFSIDAGLLLQGSPKTTLTAQNVAGIKIGGVALTPAQQTTFTTNLQTEEDNVNNDLSNFKQYPVLAVGLNYNF